MLAKKGYSVLLIERDALGAGQTIASQGILHGGIKYTLGGRATEAARAVAAMPARWASAMSNAPDADIDLRSVQTLCPAQYLWSSSSLFSRITARAAATAIRTRVRTVEPAAACEGLRNATGTSVYQVDEPVIDPRSLIETLAAQFTAAGGVAVQAPDGCVPELTGRTVNVAGQTVRFSTIVLAAGEGNAAVLRALGIQAPAMQRRPLHMVMARSPVGAPLPALYGHCIAALSDKPRMTVTTQVDQTPGAGGGRRIWYIGGQIAENGVNHSREEQIAAAQVEVAACLPWIGVSKVQWATFTIDRAEGLTPGGARPDTPVVAPLGAGSPALAVWPTKLVFAPLVADMVVAHVAGITEPSTTGPRARCLGSLDRLARLGVAPLPWERGDIQWS